MTPEKKTEANTSLMVEIGRQTRDYLVLHFEVGKETYL